MSSLLLIGRFGIFPVQTDLVMAYVQAAMRERVFCKLPEYWKNFLPEYLWVYCGRPLLLVKALYGYTYSGKFLYQDEAEFLGEEGFTQTLFPGLWYKKLEGENIMMVLHYVDDILSASTDDEAHKGFLQRFGVRFDMQTRPVADWYLQARLQQDKEKNIYLDQTRYAKSIVT